MPQYHCTMVGCDGGAASTLPEKANRQMADMAGRGWRLLSTSTLGGTAVVYLFWAKD